MIREFWQEHREEKKKQKQLKKENRKKHKTKEQIAYNVFGVLLAIFIIFGSIGFACSNTGDVGDFSWSRAIGMTDEMIDAINAPVDKNLILTENVLSSVDWTDAQVQLSANDINIVTDGKLSEDILTQEIYLSSNLTIDMMSLGALVYQFIEELGNGSSVELLSFKLYEDNSNTMLKTVCFLDLSTLISDSELPVVYITTISRISIHDNSLTSLNAKVQINQIEEEMNDDIVDTIDNGSLLEIAYFTNTHVVSQINTLAVLFNSNLQINGADIIFVPKN